MSTRYESFLPEVLPFVPECPELVALNAIRNACIEFCDKSLIWLFEHDPITTVAYLSTYELDLPDFTTTARILDAWYDNLTLAPKGEDDLRRIFMLDWREMEGSPQYFTQSYPEEVTLVPQPTITVTNALKLIVALKPTRDSIDVDDFLYDQWAERIGYGALARLHDIPNQSFSDANAAIKYRSMFEVAIGQAKQERNRGLTRQSMRVRPPRFF